MKIAIVILNWNGLKLLKEFLPSVVNNSGDNPIYIIDNNSDDNSIDFLNKNYINITLIRNDKNYGYAKGYNEGLRHVNEEVFCLLNNDVEVTTGWLDPVIKEFEFDNFLVVAQPKILDYKNKNKFEYAGAAGGYIDYFGYPYCRGRINDSIEIDKGQYDKNVDIFWASGACFIVRKKTFDELNGFDERFFCHMEEIDLCWRINNYNRDLKKIFIHDSIVYHLGGGSLSKNSPVKTFYNFRNSYYMIRKNMNTLNNDKLFMLKRISQDLMIATYYFLLLQFGKFFAIILAITYSLMQRMPYMSYNFNNKTKNHYVIKSIIYKYLILKKRVFSKLNKS